MYATGAQEVDRTVALYVELASLHSEGKNSADGSLNVITFDASVNVGGKEREREEREIERARSTDLNH